MKKNRQKKQERKRKMNLKKKLLMILLQIVLILTLSAQTSTENKKNLENELGIDLTKTYQGTEVQAIIDIILDEADKSIDKAYKEGYRQATVELLPDIEYWKNLYWNKKTYLFSDCLTYALIGFGSGFLIGGVTGFYIRFNLSSN